MLSMVYQWYQWLMVPHPIPSLRHVVDGFVRCVIRELRQGVGVGLGHPTFPGAAANGGDELRGLDVQAAVRVGHLGGMDYDGFNGTLTGF